MSDKVAARRIIEEAFKQADKVQHRGGHHAPRPLKRGDAVQHVHTGRPGVFLGRIGHNAAVVRFIALGGEVEKLVIPLGRLTRR